LLRTYLEIDLTIVMPVFNEELGIEEFLLELEEFLGDLSPEYLIINDASTDGSLGILNDLAHSGFPLTCHTNLLNCGHGYSTLLGLELGLLKSRTVLIVDGAGRFPGAGIREFVEQFHKSNYDVGEGIRTYRNEPLFRRFVSFTTRLLLLASTGKIVKDPNTPLRIYNSSLLESLLQHVSPNSMIPNLEISTHIRKKNIPVLEFEIVVQERRGGLTTGSTWGQSVSKNLPNRKFLLFCFKGLLVWCRSIKQARKRSSNPGAKL